MEVKVRKSVAILGRQPALGIAELESLYGTEKTEPFGDQACFIDQDACSVDFGRLGGSVRVGTILLKLPSAHWKDIEKLLVEKAPEHAAKVEGKLTFGISVFGMHVPAKKVAHTALQMKKAIKKSGKSVRMVPHKDVSLGSAVVLHNKLHRDGNWELLVISDGKTAFLAQTNFIQDIDAYTARDRTRPMRDAKVGMLPPKLAQIIINLAVGKIENQELGIRNQEELHLLDPFCGTGVLLQEALLMGMFAHGSDIDKRMIEFSRKNITWLHENTDYTGRLLTLNVADATDYCWIEAPMLDAVASETFLGKPLSNLPPSDQLKKIMHEANQINHQFLQNLAPQLRSGTQLCLAMPTWRGKREFLHLSCLDHLTDMGYTRRKFKHARNADLIYHRDGQVVARELLVLEKD